MMFVNLGGINLNRKKNCQLRFHSCRFNSQTSVAHNQLISLAVFFIVNEQVRVFAGKLEVADNVSIDSQISLKYRVWSIPLQHWVILAVIERPLCPSYGWNDAIAQFLINKGTYQSLTIATIDDFPRTKIQS